MVFSRNQCRKIGVVSKRVFKKSRFMRKHAPLGMSGDEMYQYYTGCSNGLQMDCFDTRFVELRPKWERYLKRGLVYPRKFIVLESSPAARKYNQERCALNVVEEEELVKGWERSQVWEHTASVHLDEAHVAFVNAKRSRNFTIGQLKSLLVQLGNAQEELAKRMMVVVDCKARIEDVGLVRDIEHNIRHAKFAAADTFKRWVSENRA